MTTTSLHRGITCVVVPPAPPVPEPTPEEAAGAVAAVEEACRLVLPYVEAAGSTDIPAVGWRGSPGARRYLARVALVGIGRDPGLDLAARIGAGLDGGGWRLATETGPEVATLLARARLSGRTVRVGVTVGEGATVVDVESGQGEAVWA